MQKTPLFLLRFLTVYLLPAGIVSCQSAPQVDRPKTVIKKDAIQPSPAADKTSRDDFGEDWFDSSKRRDQVPSPQQPATWSFVLETFTEGEHNLAAQRMINNLRTIAPQVQGARVHTTPKGSLVVYGNYSGRDDPQADRDREWLKSITYQNRPVFNRVLLSRLDLRLTQSELHPYDLLTARKQYPNVDPLYTLDVAIWDDFDSGKMSYEQVRRSAEAYSNQLRAQGHDAYFYHDDANKRSVVTVGLFDRRAIHPKSGLFSNDVTQLMKKFPVRLTNGEELLEMIDRFRPELGTRPQKPHLVLVPSM